MQTSVPGPAIGISTVSIAMMIAAIANLVT